MDTDMWNMVVNATYAVNDVNNHFQKYHSEREENLFYLSVVSSGKSK